MHSYSTVQTNYWSLVLCEFSVKVRDTSAAIDNTLVMKLSPEYKISNWCELKIITNKNQRNSWHLYQMSQLAMSKEFESHTPYTNTYHVFTFACLDCRQPVIGRTNGSTICKCSTLLPFSKSFFIS